MKGNILSAIKAAATDLTNGNRSEVKYADDFNRLMLYCTKLISNDKSEIVFVTDLLMRFAPSVELGALFAEITYAMSKGVNRPKVKIDVNDIYKAWKCSRRKYLDR